MQFLADLLSALFNATIIGAAVLILVMAAEEAEHDGSPGDARGPAPPAVVVAAGETPKRVIVHLLEWRWDDVSAECEAVLGPDGLGCGDAWLCEHRHPAVLGMVGFGNAAAGAEVAHWWDDGGGRIAFGRGERGFVVINNIDAPCASGCVPGWRPGVTAMWLRAH